MLGLAKSRRDLSRATIGAEGTCDADPFSAKSRAWTRQGGCTEAPGPSTGDYVDGTRAFAAWLEILSAERCGQFSHASTADDGFWAQRRELARQQADPVHAGCYGDLSRKRSGDRYAGSRNHWGWRL